MDIGTVFIWRNYPFAVAGKIKDRWFLYLGTHKEDPFSEIFLLIPTATTQLHHFELGGRRAGHSFVYIRAKDGYGFEADCAIDFDEVFYDISERVFTQYDSKGDIVVKGKIADAPMLKRICNAIQRARDVDQCIKRSVKNNLKSIGVDV